MSGPIISQDFPATDTPEAEEAAARWAPIEERVGDEYVFTWPRDHYGIGFNHLREEKKELHGEITVVTDEIHPRTGRKGLVHWGSFNLSSDRSRGTLSRMLAKRTNTEESFWETALLHACFRTQEVYRTGQEEVDVSMHESRPVQWAIKDVLLKGESNVLFGPPSGLKSFCLDAMAVAIACGKPVGDFTPQVEGPCLLIDYETSEDEVTSRCKRIARAHGLSIPKGGIIYRQYWRALADEATVTRALIDRYKIVFAGVDSIGWAVHGELTPQLVLPMFNTLRSFGSDVTRVILSHITKADAQNPNKPASEIGTQFIRAAARCSWEVSRGDTDHLGNISIALYNRKINQGRERQPLYLNVHFNDPYGPVTFGHTNVDDSPELLNKASFVERIRHVLKDGGKDLKDIAEELGEKPESVKRQLHRYRGRQVIPISDYSKGGRGNTQTWALIDNSHDEPDDLEEDVPIPEEDFQGEDF